MSKMDDMRAMREARYQRDQARSGSQARPAQRPVAPRPAETTPKVESASAQSGSARSGSAEAPEDVDAATAEQLCGHRNMSGRTCTREHGHAAKSHRYS